jgi:hypothetical protein
MARSKKRSKGWDLDELRAHYQGWAQSDEVQVSFRDQPRKEIPALLKKPEAPATFPLIALKLGNLAWWESKSGANAVLRGDATGWVHLRLSLDFREWSLRILQYLSARARAEGQRSANYQNHFQLTLCFAQAVALRDDPLADWCGGLMIDELLAPTGLLTGWDETPLHLLMAWLYANWRGRRLPPTGGGTDLGVYRPIVDGWDDDGAFRAAVVRACDYHCARCDPDIDDTGEFWHGAFHVFAAEILALLRVRMELLGADVRVAHPLLDTPLGSVPEAIPHRAEPLLREVTKRVRRAEDRLLRGGSSTSRGLRGGGDRPGRGPG